MARDAHERDDGNTHNPPARRSPPNALDERMSSSVPDMFRMDAGNDPGPNWRELLEGVWRWKWLIVATTALGIGAGLFLMRSAEPVYETRATIWLGPADQDQGPIKPADIFEGEGWADLIASQAVLEPVAMGERLYLQPVSGIDSTDLSGLQITAQLEPGTYRLEARPNDRFELQRADGTIVQRGRFGRDTVGLSAGFQWEPDPSLVQKGPAVVFQLVRPSEAAARIRSHLQVSFDPRAGNLINTRFQWATAPAAARVHNGIIDSFLRVAQRLKRQKLEEVVSILDRQTDYAAARLDSAEYALENYRVATVTLPSEPRTAVRPGEDGAGATTLTPGSSVFSTYFEKSVERDQLVNQVDDLRQILQTARQDGRLNVLSLRMNPATEQSRELAATLDELAEKQAERRAMLQQYTDAYPPVLRITERIRSLEQSVIPGLVEELVAQLETRIGELDRQIDSRASELREVPSRSIREARLRREVMMAEDLHNNLLGRLKNAELAARTNLPDLQVVDRATIPGSPAEDPGPRYLMIASLAGLGLGLGGSLLMGRLDDKVRHPEHVTGGLGLPVLGLVPRIATAGKKRDEEASHEVLESFRAIRGQLTRSGSRHDSIYLVTSPSPREGKTLVVANLGLSFAASGARTLLVDADTRRGNMDKFFGVRSSPGLTEFLTGEAEIDEIEITRDIHELTMIPHGDLKGFRPDLLDSSRMDEFLDRVRARYDVVLFDAPPLMAGADSLVLGERADGVVVVLRTGETDREAARARLEGLGHFDLPVVGAVMNDVPANGRYYRYYYYSYQPPEVDPAAVVRA